ncbi:MULTISPECIES: PP2C family protein-serine/threonine phosphatase [unclassified Streptomyces]|uniref:PP2C family protein-serine/threonine phosphatase n=1 Tax=unclassified Streptomyces TaxID=2593676 RepID=UPI002DDC4236|nr:MULTISPECIES: PP2C family protein-serine/threonine phosphatase [unclassified Streptomyces]WSA91242.1 serine/threonine-protein phosphatase [Streptomyces sp. NBC_01795]WSB75566.1 serine/threonine-protein phosphatase [Streptomyces sp. NBC_01775]WSS16149.1 serine/threonine-protein phosphatase [Streptomyces sp. NBC_01186]WSS44968.1 serine/threonine-protein phosphatase [Streptomyces sp. NBC_01187]
MEQQQEPGTEQPKSLSNRAFLLWSLGLTLLVIGLSLVAGSEVRLIGLLIFLPAVASSVGTVRQTVAASCWATTGAVVSTARAPQYRFDDGVLLVVLTALFSVLAVYGCHWRVAREREVLRLRSAAAVVQRHILHPLPELTAQALVEGVYEPVQEDKLFGGDIYDVADTPYGTRVLIGDVQGKGLSAVGAVFAVLGAFREAAHREQTLTGLVESLETSVVRHNAYARSSGEPERFVTALVLGVDAVDEETAQAVNCGHLAPYLLGLPGGPQQVRPGAVNVPLGLASLVAEPRTAGWFTFPPGTTLLLYTDGLSEARGEGGTYYPVERRLAELTGPGDGSALSPGSLVQALWEDVRDFSRPQQQDDLAILTVHRSPTAERV